MAMVNTNDPASRGVARTHARPWTLLARAAGPPSALAAKLDKLARTLRAWGDARILEGRLERLRALGVIDAAPTRVQVVVGSIDMLRFWIGPAAADYYAHKGIDFTFHQVLRVLDDPAAMVDPVGFFVDRDAVIGHLLQVVHANPVYDVQLLSSHEDGLDELVAQTRAMIAGVHPRAASIGAIVEEADYHARLLAFVERFREDPAAAPPVRANVAGDPARFGGLERTFGTLPAAMRYFARLPRTLLGAARHLVAVRSFPLALAEPEEVRA